MHRSGSSWSVCFCCGLWLSLGRSVLVLAFLLFPVSSRVTSEILEIFPATSLFPRFGSPLLSNEGPLPADALLVLMEAVGRSFSNDTCGN